MVNRGADQAGDQLRGVRDPVVRVDGGHDRPPGPGQVQPADQARGRRADHPVLNRGAEIRFQRRRAEHHVEVRAGSERPTKRPPICS